MLRFPVRKQNDAEVASKLDREITAQLNNSSALEQNTNLIFDQLNAEYLRNRSFWEWLLAIFYGLAIVLQLFGVYFGFLIKEKNESSDLLIDELRKLRGQVDRLNKSQLTFAAK